MMDACTFGDKAAGTNPKNPNYLEGRLNCNGTLLSPSTGNERDYRNTVPVLPHAPGDTVCTWS